MRQLFFTSSFSFFALVFSPLAEAGFEGASQSCIDTYNSNGGCPLEKGYVYTVSATDSFTSVLDGFCTGTCFASLRNHRESLLGDCAPNATWRNRLTGSRKPITHRVDEAIFIYNQICTKRSNGQYCNVWFMSKAAKAPDASCDECSMNAYYMDAHSPFDGEVEQKQLAWAYIAKKCDYQGPPTMTVVTHPADLKPTATPTPTCSSRYTVQPGDTAVGISLSQNVATQSLLALNGFEYETERFRALKTWCIPNKCQIYLLSGYETCSSLSTDKDLSVDEILAWNPFLNENCDNIGIAAGQTICLSKPFAHDFGVGNTKTGYFTEPAPLPEDMAFRTTTECGRYYHAKVGDDCTNILPKFAISLHDFVFLNPTVRKDCSNLVDGKSYCVAPVGNIRDYPGYVDETPVTTLNAAPTHITDLTHTPVSTHNPDEMTATPFVGPFTDDNTSSHTTWKEYLERLLGLSIKKISSFIADKFFVSQRPDRYHSGQLVLSNSSPNQNSNSGSESATKTYAYDHHTAPFISYNTARPTTTEITAHRMLIVYPRGEGEIAGCTNWFRAEMTCRTHLSMLQMKLSDFYRFNPSVKKDCSHFFMGTFYCYSINNVEHEAATPKQTWAIGM